MRVGQNRKSAGEKQPFRSQIVESSPRGGGFGDNHDIETRGQLGTVGADDFTESAPDFISVHSPANTLGGDEADAGRGGFGVLQHAETEKTAL